MTGYSPRGRCAGRTASSRLGQLDHRSSKFVHVGTPSPFAAHPGERAEGLSPVTLGAPALGAWVPKWLREEVTLSSGVRAFHDVLAFFASSKTRSGGTR